MARPQDEHSCLAHEGSDLRVGLDHPGGQGDELRLAQVRVDPVPVLHEDVVEVRGVLGAAHDVRDAVGPHRLEHPRVQRVGVGGENPDHLIRPEHSVHHGHLQQAGGEERHAHGRRQLLLEQREKSAGGGDGTAPRRLQFLRRLDEWLEERRILFVHHPLGRGAAHDAESYGEIERGGVADIAGDAREDRVQGEDTHRLAIVTSTALDDWRLLLSRVRWSGSETRIEEVPESIAQQVQPRASMMARPGNSTTWGLVDRYDRPFAAWLHSGMGAARPGRESSGSARGAP
jgi:hypothetical protein